VEILENFSFPKVRAPKSPKYKNSLDFSIRQGFVWPIISNVGKKQYIYKIGTHTFGTIDCYLSFKSFLHAEFIEK
jgi:hypothetical protein